MSDDLNSSFNYRSRTFLVLWMVSFILSFSTRLVPTPRAYLTSAFAGNVEATTLEALGVMISLGFAAQTIGYFAGGFLADVAGRRRIVATSFIVLAAGCGRFAEAPNLYIMYAASFIEFFAAGLSSPAISALVADCSARYRWADGRGLQIFEGHYCVLESRRPSWSPIFFFLFSILVSLAAS